MVETEAFQVILVTDGKLNDDQRRRMAKRMEVALEHWQSAVGFLDEEDDPSVIEVYHVEHCELNASLKDGSD